jgi:hypothetical protein
MANDFSLNFGSNIIVLNYLVHILLQVEWYTTLRVRQYEKLEIVSLQKKKLHSFLKFSHFNS